ncbi:oxygen-dependent tRNA uridine(34) hydroxylase TrhO [Carboxylicivirga caseinilyticus]|uniref:oxygen-dependent tRNA uridine(34) hydroxylase TrhO n=1 Tax=Carboxylicivirga caseinilyticus TaxID=3417572 RepID=UPI003D3582C0|nr:rhodanese-related sulfurtransferase [Marinilabiliaceae bacterium A049]
MDPNSKNKGLYNKLGPEELKKRLAEETFKRTTVSFYKYILINDTWSLRNLLYEKWNQLNCLGRIYIASEGINAQMSVPDHKWEDFEKHLRSISLFEDIPFKIAVEDDGKSFLKLQVKVRKQIVADGLQAHEYDVTNVGQHLSAKEWNQALEEGATVVDMRNHYESEIGHFKGAILPDAETFKDELPEVLEKLKGKENEKILLYCTGGVRCEKTSAYLKHHGFSDVNQLLGGIIDYSRQIKSQGLENTYNGKNFVFDNRLGERISDDVISNCHQCGKPCDTHTNCANKKCNLLFIQCDDCKEKYNACCGDDCKTYFLATPDQKLELEERLIFKKGKRFHKA